jgi:hypothetical protein
MYHFDLNNNAERFLCQYDNKRNHSGTLWCERSSFRRVPVPVRADTILSPRGYFADRSVFMVPGLLPAGGGKKQGTVGPWPRPIWLDKQRTAIRIAFPLLVADWLQFP